MRYPDLVAERRNLLNVDGRIFRQPLIEPVPAYQSSNQTFQAIAQALLAQTWSQADITDIANFVSLELFPAWPDSLDAPANYSFDFNTRAVHIVGLGWFLLQFRDSDTGAILETLPIQETAVAAAKPPLDEIPSESQLP